MAERLGISNQLAGTGGSHGQIVVSTVELTFGGNTLRAPAFILPDHADDSVTVYLGYGRERAGQVGNGAGFNAYNLRTTAALWFGQGLQISKTGDEFSLACTQHHGDMEGRELVRYTSLADYVQHPDFAKREADLPENQISLYPQWNYSGHAWGMAVDTGSCIGCNAASSLARPRTTFRWSERPGLSGREMHWLRIDRYYAGGRETRSFIPTDALPCTARHAPCE